MDTYSLTKYICPVEITLDIIGGKWKGVILWWLKEDVRSFSELKLLMPKITSKVLTQQLRELEADGVISRQTYREAPVRVEYSLTDKGVSLIPITDLMCDWGMQHLPAEQSERRRIETATVLIVTEDLELRSQLERDITNFGAQAISVSSQPEAIEQLARRQIDVLLIDTEIPQSYLFLEQMGTSDAVAIALINPNPENRRFAVRAGFPIHLIKPPELCHLIAAIASITRR
jgi:DNA-binding HxlR family transcriptional regulator/CheY-like chemotaxis protein